MSAHKLSWHGTSTVSRAANALPVVLVVDDEPVNRRLIAGLLQGRFDTLEAASGPEALAAAADQRIDIAIVDINMPGMDGFQTTSALKGQTTERSLPVVLMTTSNEEPLLSEGLIRGADDFLIKPVRRVLLEAKIRALLRAAAAFDALHDHNVELNTRRQHAKRDYDVARSIFDIVARRSPFALPDMVVRTSALDQFNGDFVLTSATGDTLRILVGDFAGHGLAAAVGAIPVSEAFYTMTGRNMSAEALVRELGAKMHRMFPRDLFLACCVAEISFNSSLLRVWNGGLPDALVFDSETKILGRLRSMNPPLGILDPLSIDTTVVEMPFPIGARLAIFSDGLIEAETNRSGQFGIERVEEAIQRRPGETGWAPELWLQHVDITSRATPADDVTFVGLTHTHALAASVAAHRPAGSTGPRTPPDTDTSTQKNSV